MKKRSHPVDRTANWCIGGCWFTLAQPWWAHTVTGSCDNEGKGLPVFGSIIVVLEFLGWPTENQSWLFFKFTFESWEEATRSPSFPHIRTSLVILGLSLHQQIVWSGDSIFVGKQ
jgi:hypothetical protein